MPAPARQRMGKMYWPTLASVFHRVCVTIAPTWPGWAVATTG